MGRYVQPSRRGILGRQWAGLVENALCPNSVQPVTDPERYSSSVGLNAQSDVAAVQLANHRFQIEPLPHVKSPSQRVRNARGSNELRVPSKVGAEKSGLSDSGRTRFRTSQRGDRLTSSPVMVSGTATLAL
jgi:hypothetical protein